MRYMNQDYVVQELLGMISARQLEGEIFPELSNDRILSIADSFLFEWNELGDPDANFEAMLAWNLDQHLSHA